MKRLLIPTVMIFALGSPFAALANKKKEDDKSKESSEVTVEKDSDPLGGFGATVIYSHTLGKGTFSATESSDAAQPYYNMAWSLRPTYTISKENKVKLGVRVDFDVDIVENFASSNTRPHDVQLRDIRLYVTWTDFLKIEPAWLSFSGAATIYAPTSRASQITGKILGTRLSTSMKFKPVDWFQFSYGFGFTKNWNKATTGQFNVDEFDAPPQVRANDAADLGDGNISTGTTNTEWSLNHGLGIAFAIPGGVSLDVAWTYYQYFKYGNKAIDEFSSPNAQAGKEITDLMVGTIEVGYSITDYLSLALGTSVEQLPKTDDNASFRFPFWDTTNGLANRQTFYFDIAGSF